MSLTIRIPASIDLRLTPNRANTNRHVKARIKDELQATTGWALKAAIPHASYSEQALPIRLDYVIARAKGRQAFDDDNAKAGLKFVQDSIAQHIGVNDRHITVGTVEQIRDPEGIGWIEVTITPTVADERRVA